MVRPTSQDMSTDENIRTAPKMGVHRVTHGHMGNIRARQAGGRGSRKQLGTRAFTVVSAGRHGQGRFRIGFFESFQQTLEGRACV